MKPISAAYVWKSLQESSVKAKRKDIKYVRLLCKKGQLDHANVIAKRFGGTVMKFNNKFYLNHSVFTFEARLCYSNDNEYNEYCMRRDKVSNAMSFDAWYYYGGVALWEKNNPLPRRGTALGLRIW